MRIAWKLLAGVVVCGAGLLASDYQVGVARVRATQQPANDGPEAKALALADRRGGRVVILELDADPLPPSFTDLVAARAQQAYGLERSELLIAAPLAGPGTESAPLDPYDLRLAAAALAATGAAIGKLAPADLSYTASGAGAVLEARAPDGGVRPVLSCGEAKPDPAALFIKLCGGGHASPAGVSQRLRGPLRTAFRIAELPPPPEGFQAGQPMRRPAYPVQAIRLGNDLAILSLGGEAPAGGITPRSSDRKMLLITSAREGELSGEARENVMNAVRAVLRRVGLRLPE